MTLKSSQYVRGTMKGLIPFILCLALMFLTILPYQMPFLHMVTPSFALLGVFYWTVNRPEAMPLAAAFILGLIPDLWSGGPPGLQALMLVLTRGFLLSQRRFIVGRSILVGWLAFSLVAVMWGILIWAFASLYLGYLLNIIPVLVQVLLTIAIYPPMTGFFGWFDRTLIE